MSKPTQHAKPDLRETRRRLWRETPWPWELEAITLCIALGGALLALNYEHAHLPAYARAADAFQMDITRNSWLIVTLVAYAGHMLLGRTVIRDVSTPFHLVANPVLFALLGFFNFRSAYTRAHGARAWDWPWVELFLILLAITALCLLLARVRMQRVMLPFRDLRWDIDLAPAHRAADEPLWPILSRLQPVFYPPHRYRANAAGIEIEGLFYVTLVSYPEIAAITLIPQGDWASAGIHLTRSMRNLVVIQLKGRQEPIVVSPEKADAFLEYTQRRLRECVSPSRATHRGD
jgi:hypothetical protein